MNKEDLEKANSLNERIEKAKVLLENMDEDNNYPSRTITLSYDNDSARGDMKSKAWKEVLGEKEYKQVEAILVTVLENTMRVGLAKLEAELSSL